MPKVNVYDMAGKNVGEIELSEAVFGIKPNPAVVHQVVVNYLANQRQGTQTKGHWTCPSGLHPCTTVA